VPKLQRVRRKFGSDRCLQLHIHTVFCLLSVFLHAVSGPGMQYLVSDSMQIPHSLPRRDLQYRLVPLLYRHGLSQLHVLPQREIYSPTMHFRI
jgi:hypothetical protein